MVADNIANRFDPPSVNSIIRVSERVSSPTDRDHLRNSGCLMANTVFEVDEPAEDIARKIADDGDL